MSDAASELYHDGWRYDALYGTSGADVDFYRELARRHPGPILELACGTGKYLIPWARDGAQVSGVDAAQPMLDYAARKAAQGGIAIRLHHADMRDFSLPGATMFALIVIAGNSLCHLLTHDDLQKCLACVHAHLATGGRFVVDVFVPDVRLLARDADLRQPFGRYEDPQNGAAVELSHTARYDPATQINHITIFERRAGRAGECSESLALKMWFPCELEAALRCGGFEILERFGGHDRSPFSAASGKQILICGSCLS